MTMYICPALMRWKVSVTNELLASWLDIHAEYFVDHRKAGYTKVFEYMFLVLESTTTSFRKHAKTAHCIAVISHFSINN